MPRVAQGFFEELLDLPEPAGGQGGGMTEMPFGGFGRGRSLRRWQHLMAETTAHADFRDPTGLEAAELRRMTPPVRLVYGGRSQFLPTRNRLARLLPPHESLTLPGAGHYFPLLRSHAFLDAMVTEA